MVLYENEVAVDDTVVRALLREQRPEWADLPLSAAGAGKENVMYRLGDELVVRLPRTADNARSVQKEQEWLPRLAPLLAYSVPEPVYAGTPTSTFPLVWSVYRWIDGELVGADSVRDWARLGADLAGFVRELHSIDLMGATRTGDLSWYRGGYLQELEWVSSCFDECRTTLGSQLDVETLEQLWRAALALPEPCGQYVWLHGDLRPSNLLARDGMLHAVIDFGSLTVGLPDAEHATVWGLPPEARQAYWNTLNLDDLTWTRARAWAIAIILYYGRTWPAFVNECQALFQEILTDAAAR